MKNRFIPAFVMLVAGLVACLFSIVKQWDVTYSLVVLLFTLLIFYCIGLIAARIIGHIQAQRAAELKAIADEEERLRLEKEQKEQEELEGEESDEHQEEQMM